MMKRIPIFPLFVAIVLFLLSCSNIKSTTFPFIQFLGAAQSVGGSAILVDTGKTRFLIDYGLYYDEDDQQKNQMVLDNPEKLDFVLLTHAHIDHSGRLPLLYKGSAHETENIVR